MFINYSKTNVIVFRKGRQYDYVFTFNAHTLEIVNEYKYVGVLFCKNNSFLTTKKHIAQQGSRALYALLLKPRNMHLAIDLQIELLNYLISWLNLYFFTGAKSGASVTSLLKYTLNLKSCTPKYMIYGEVGIYPLKIDIQARSVFHEGVYDII